MDYAIYQQEMHAVQDVQRAALLTLYYDIAHKTKRCGYQPNDLKKTTASIAQIMGPHTLQSRGQLPSIAETLAMAMHMYAVNEWS